MFLAFDILGCCWLKIAKLEGIDIKPFYIIAIIFFTLFFLVFHFVDVPIGHLITFVYLVYLF